MRSQEEKGFLLEHPELFLVEYFPHRLEPLKDFHLELIRVATQEKRGLIFFPAAHGKTTIDCELLPIWELCCDPNILLALILKNDTEAKNVMRSLIGELVSNDALVRDFGPFKPEDDDNKAWSLTRIDVAKRTRQHKSGTIAAFGAGAKTALGYRTHHLIADDIVDTKNSSSEIQRAQMRTWWDMAAGTMPEREEDKITVVGTMFHPADLYHDLRELRYPDSGEKIYTEALFDAIVDEEAHVTLWRERWPWTRLMGEKASMGTLEFNKRYRNMAVDPSQMVFKEEFIKGGYSSLTKQRYPGCLDHEYCVGDYEPTWKRVSGFDVAVGAGRSAKFCAHIVLSEGSCAEHDRCFWVTDLIRDQMTQPKQVGIILEQHGEYGLFKSVIEANSFQASLCQAVEQKMDELGLAYRMEPHYTTRTNKPDPESGVEAMSPWFENGKVHIPWGNQESRRKMQIFVDELIQYPGKTTDTVMACWFAWRALQQARPPVLVQNRMARQAPFWSRAMPGRSIQNPAYAPRQEEEVTSGDHS